MQQKQIQEALQGDNVMQCPNLTEQIYDCIFKLQTALGVKLDDNDLNNLVNIFCKDIVTYFKYMTLQEIQLALHLGARGEFEKSYGLNAVNCYKWLKSYDLMRMEFKRSPQPRVLGERKIDYENHKTQKEFYDFLIDTVKKFNEIPVGWNYCPVYHYMVREGMLKLSEKEIKETEQRVRVNKAGTNELKMLDDEQQFDVLFRAQAVKDWLTKTYGVTRRDFKIKKLGNNLITLTAN